MVAELIVASKAHLSRLLFEDLATIEGVVRTATLSVLQNLKSAHDWSRGILSDVSLPAPRLSAEAADSEIAELDDLDRRICEHLRDDGRIGFPQLAVALGITESMARRRLEGLLSSGALHPVTLVNPGLLGYQVELFFWLQLELSKLEEVARALVQRPEVRYLSTTIGYSDLVGEVILRTQADVQAFQMETIGSLPGVRGHQMVLEIQTQKRAFLQLEGP